MFEFREETILFGSGSDYNIAEGSREYNEPSLSRIINQTDPRTHCASQCSLSYHEQSISVVFGKLKLLNSDLGSSRQVSAQSFRFDQACRFYH